MRVCASLLPTTIYILVLVAILPQGPVSSPPRVHTISAVGQSSFAGVVVIVKQHIDGAQTPVGREPETHLNNFEKARKQLVPACGKALNESLQMSAASIGGRSTWVHLSSQPAGMSHDLGVAGTVCQTSPQSPKHPQRNQGGDPACLVVLPRGHKLRSQAPWPGPSDKAAPVPCPSGTSRLGLLSHTSSAPHHSGPDVLQGDTRRLQNV